MNALAPHPATRPAPIADRRTPWVMTFARWYALRKVARELDGVWVSGLDVAREALAREPVVLALNHVAWWDVLLLVLLDEALGGEMRVLMDSRNLRKLPYLGHIGAIPLDRRAPEAAARDLEAAARWLDRPGRVVTIFPQGRQRAAHLRPLAFRRGVEQLVAASGATVIPAALQYGFREAPAPAAGLRLGPHLPSSAVGRAGGAAVLEDVIDTQLALLDPLFDGAAPGDCGLDALVPSGAARTDDGPAARLLARWMNA